MERLNIKVRAITPLVLLISLLCLNSFSLVASSYGADIDDWDGVSAYIRNVGCGKYLTVPDGTVSDGKEIKIYDAVEDVSQQWSICKLNNGRYYIYSDINSNYFLSVENDMNGAKIVLKYLEPGDNIPEEAQFYMMSDSDYQCAYLVSQISVANINIRGLDCKNDATTNGTNVVLNDVVEDFNDAVSQMWVFESLDRSIELNSWDLVDIGGHCDWSCSANSYMDMVERATEAWNDYIGDEVFRVDTFLRVKDIEINNTETDPTGKGALARTYSSNRTINGDYASTIYFFDDSMDLLESDLQRQKTVMHELGHALGLDDNRESTSNDKLGNIMQQGALPYSTFISLDDKASVKEAYNGF